MTWAQWAQALGGLGLFLFSMRFLTSVLNRTIARRFKPLLARTLASPSRGLGVGFVSTLVVQASAITIIASMGLLETGLLNFEQAFFVMLGATLGTTVKAWAWALNLHAAGPLILGLSSLGLVVVRKPGRRAALEATMAIGFTFLGLDLLADGLAPLDHSTEFLVWLRGFEAHSLLGQFVVAAVGCLLTVALQSSTTFIFLVLELSALGLLGLPIAGALILGANVGTTATPVLAAVEHERGVQRLAFSHVVVKALGVMLALLLFPFLLSGAGRLAGLLGFTSPVAQLIALHTGFNLLNVGGWMFLAPLYLGLMRKFWPEEGLGQGMLPMGVRRLLANAPERALQEVDRLVHGLASEAQALTDACFEMLSSTALAAGSGGHAAVAAETARQRAFDEAKDAVYDILASLAGGQQAGPHADKVRSRLLQVGAIGALGQRAMALSGHLEQGRQLGGFELPLEVAHAVAPVRALADRMWMGIHFGQKGLPEGPCSPQSLQGVAEALETAYFTHLAQHGGLRSDQSTWVVDALTLSRGLLEALHSLLLVTHRVAGPASTGPLVQHELLPPSGSTGDPA